MSYIPSPYTGYFNRVGNTVISGNELLSYLTGEDVRDLQFKATVQTGGIPINPIVAGSTLTGGTGATMTPAQLISATFQQASVVFSPTGTTGATGYICLGPDTAAQALSYIQILNLTDSNIKNILRFTLTEPLGQANSILLGNSSNTASYIVPRNSYTGSLTNTGSTLLFSEAISSGAISGRDGNQRLVRVSATGSPPSIVYFDVLGSSV